MLCHYSRFFSHALASGFQEAIPNQVHLEEDDVDIVRHFTTWVYLGNRAFTGLSPEDLCRIWIFGAKYQIPELQNRVMNQIVCSIDELNCCECPAMLDLVFSNTHPKAQLRKFLLITLICEQETSFLHNLSKEVVIEIATLQARYLWGETKLHWREVGACQFHEHAGHTE